MIHYPKSITHRRHRSRHHELAGGLHAGELLWSSRAKMDSNLVPSVVALDEKNQVIVGNAARKYLIETPERAVYSVKRLMGGGVEDIQEELKLFPFQLAETCSRRSAAHQARRQELHSAGDFGASFCAN